MANLNRYMQNFPQKGRGLGHVTPKIFGIRSNISSKLLQLEILNLVRSFALGKPSGRINNFPQKGRDLGHVTPNFLTYNRTYLQNYLSYKLQILYKAWSESRDP